MQSFLLFVLIIILMGGGAFVAGVVDLVMTLVVIGACVLMYYLVPGFFWGIVLVVGVCVVGAFAKIPFEKRSAAKRAAKWQQEYAAKRAAEIEKSRVDHEAWQEAARISHRAYLADQEVRRRCPF
jgi:ABC-type microcin C transport system permease subunit YejB